MSPCRAYLLALSLCCTAFTAPATAQERPNIVLIVADDQGWNDIGYHNPELRTPVLDRLVRESIELDAHYVQPQCTPTRVALMTGRYPSRFGPHCMTASNTQAFPIGTPTMASMLKNLGYATALCGKWHLGSKFEWGPLRHGFDHSYGSLSGAVGMYDHRYQIGNPYEKTWHRNEAFIEEEGNAIDLETREAVRWIEEKHDRPFFLYVPFHAVHTPIVPKPEWLEVNAHIADQERRMYAAVLSHMDDCIGQITKALDSTGVRNNTLLIYTSDNGAQVDHTGNTYPPPDPALTEFSSNLPLRGKKTQAYEGGIRVPAFIHWPGHLAPRKVSAPMHAVDWMPTLAKLLQYTGPAPDWDGVDLGPVLRGEATGTGPRVIYEVWGTNRQWEALRQGDWKIVRNRTKQGDATLWELYNLVEDPNESQDLAPTNPTKRDELIALFTIERAKDATRSKAFQDES